jgi:hypothetical protein
MAHNSGFSEATTRFGYVPDCINAREYAHTLQRREFSDPEHRLMFVILQDALKCLDKYALTKNSTSNTLFRETEAWVFTRSDDWVFSFDNVCAALGFNPEYIRKGVMRRKAAKRDIKRGPATTKSFWWENEEKGGLYR